MIKLSIKVTFYYDKLDIKDKLYKSLTVKNKEELNYLIKTEKLLDRYSHKLIDLSKNTEYVEEIMSEEMEKFLEAHMEYQSGLSEGREQEKAENQKEIVLNMYNKNYKLEDISEITELTLEEIEKIIHDSN